MYRIDPLRARRRWLLAILGGFALGGFTLSSWAARLPSIRAGLDLSDAELGFVLLATTAGSGAGLVASRLLLGGGGARRSLAVAALAMAAGVGIVGAGVAVESVPVLLVGFAIAGAGVGATDVLINIDGAVIERLSRRTLMPLMHAAWPAGAVVGAGVGAGCAALGIAAEAQLIAQAAVIAVAGLALVRAVPAGSRGTRRARRRRGQARARRAPHVDARLLAIGVVMLAAEFGEGAANGWISVAVRDAMGRPEAFAAAAIGIYAAAQVVVRVAAGPLVDRFGRAAMIRWTSALGLAGVILFILDLGTVPLVIGVVLWSVGVSMGFPLGMSAAAEGDDPTARVTLVASVGYVASFIGPPLIGLLAQGFGLLPALRPVAVLFLVAVLLAPAFAPRRRGTDPVVGASA
ncbi:MFS transporter [Clavibacter zhangzhiyongii]|uniref:MFS transporter n=1 Tax=Clavibacter zhangzhiyongii TaxID=2768071 RepID=A0A7L7YYY8_9MICO|nr:MFS transporter [Clavibacter zhangzhiyongii]QOD42664.1 MFS transporter [Clavibacter zhangzhiyongii]